ncbi:MAG: exodeoxyribonuclease V subunit beta [Gallionella sp.]|jgi:exodeoxyribonuclease V beta subunit
MSAILQPESFDLWGSRLIEASAGTGKTYTIAALYLRLVLGHGGEHGFLRPLRPSEILVMTFTRAATRELSDRIRAQLIYAAQCFRGEQEVDENNKYLNILINSYEDETLRKRAAWMLSTAAEGMDDASVHTIDAWCQRMLKEHAFDSGNLFDEELVADEQAMRIEAIQDYWRLSCYPLGAEALSQILKIWRNVDALIADMRELLNQDIPKISGADTLLTVLSRASAERAATLVRLKAGWDMKAETMRDWLNDQTSDKKNGWNGQKLAPRYYNVWLDTLKAWSAGQNEIPDLKTGWERFTPEGLLTARKDDAPSIILPAEFAEFAELKAAIAQLPDVAVAVRLHAAARVAERLVELKRRTASFGFSDMLSRLNAALQGPNGETLRLRIKTQYPVILIDEFQDTSPLQYQIFDRIYRTDANDRESAMLLIGDPKQSIYGFRGADINSYMRARRATDGRHYVLETNYRSTVALVGVVNHWFSHAENARSAGAFMYRKGDDNQLPFEKSGVKGRGERLVDANGAVPAMTLVHDLTLRNTESTRKLFAMRCAEQIVSWLNDPSTGFSEVSGAFKPLRPADIAILVRTGKEATAVRRALAKRSVASVYLSDKDSVFDSIEAHDLVHWLRAVANPQEVRLVRAALATTTIALGLDELGVLACDDEAFDARCEQLRQLRIVWQSQGVLAMLRQTLHQLGLAAKWLNTHNGERKLTNYLHLAELLQSASSALDGELALIRWLLIEIAEVGSQNDEQVVRLESDADLVKVITIHKSKGLEYPLVCLPYASSFREKDRKLTRFVNNADETGERRLRLQFTDEELAEADRDRLKEDLRLLYVALTRARHSLWVGFSTNKVGNSTKCVSHKSAAGYVLGGTEAINPADWLQPLQHFAANCPDIVLQAAESDTACTTLNAAASDIPLQNIPDYRANFERNWGISSFSRLTRDLKTDSVSPLQMARPADDEPDEQPDTPWRKPLGWHGYARGMAAGNFLHEQLEWLAAENFALPGNEQLSARLRRRCENAGRGEHADTLIDWLNAVVQTHLPGPDISLMQLNGILPEMEFWLPAENIAAAHIDRLCRAHLLPGVERPLLAERQLHGMLMGFIDLVFEHQGKYWILDYKSNHLGDDDAAYNEDALASAMAKHRYDVQAAIYMLALHRLLQVRLGRDYVPEQHLGGAVYLFLRGVNGPQSGVCLLPATAPLLAALA